MKGDGPPRRAFPYYFHNVTSKQGYSGQDSQTLKQISVMKNQAQSNLDPVCFGAEPVQHRERDRPDL